MGHQRIWPQKLSQNRSKSKTWYALGKKKGILASQLTCGRLEYYCLCYYRESSLLKQLKISLRSSKEIKSFSKTFVKTIFRCVKTYQMTFLKRHGSCLTNCSISFLSIGRPPKSWYNIHGLSFQKSKGQNWKQANYWEGKVIIWNSSGILSRTVNRRMMLYRTTSCLKNLKAISTTPTRE